MSKMFQVYGIGQALIPVLPPPLPFENAPTSFQTNYELGQVVFTPPKAPTAFYIYAGNGNWIQFTDADGPIESVLGTANQVTVTTASNVATLSLPAAITAPGSLTTTTTLVGGTGITATTGNIAASAGSVSASATVTGGTGVTATTGNITASAGNLVSAGTGNGISVPVTTGTGAASGTVTCNGRAGSVTFSSVSVAQNADITLTMGNTSITGSSTRCIWSLSGATTNSALTVKSYTPSANQVVWVVTNGGTATSTANITFDFLVLN